MKEQVEFFACSFCVISGKIRLRDAQKNSFFHVNKGKYEIMKKKKPKIELRYYYMPAGSPILPLLGERWVQNYGTGV